MPFAGSHGSELCYGAGGDMSKKSSDAGVISVLLERFNNQRLPRVLALKEKVDRGETLSDADLAYLEKIFSDFSQVKPLVDRNPEYMPLVAKVINLYKEIADKALENEKKA
jgi:hypothetical protein